ncbi:MAG: helix-turn-helix transcriptional regulator [Chlorobi bacterium]|nr:helix-turn-helix transcriptional regulator [Chlorobiota bacterium]
MVRKTTEIRKTTDRRQKKFKEELSPEVLIGQIVRERRKELGLRQVDLEGDEGLDRSYISKLENGQFQPCLRALVHLEKVLEFSPGDLFKTLASRTEKLT